MADACQVINLCGTLGFRASAALIRRAERVPPIPQQPPVDANPRAPSIETGMRIVLWALQRRAFPSADEIVEHFGVSKATAYRYRSHLADVLGVWSGP